MPLAQQPRDFLGLVARTAGDPSQAAPAIKRAVRSIDKDLLVFLIRSRDQWIN
ncbi:MAG: hypothetical protein J2P31_04770 [Blastocatellia bacterium]|nr:hypothetical protein [Blastocatellia bacterium]